MKKNAAFIVMSIFIMSLAYGAFEMLVPAQKDNKNIEVEIPRGSTFRQAVDILSSEKLIRDKKIFILVGRITGADRKIRAGYYSMWSSMTPFEILKILRKGRIIEFEVKVLEGDSLLEIADAFSKADIASREDFFKLSVDRDFLAAHNIVSPSFEGYIFPDTYIIPKGMTMEDAVGNMINRMREKYSEDLLSRTAKIGMTEAKILTLASIIEKEAIVDEERPLISAVYHNRLRKNMPLQADPTSIYGIKSSKEKIFRADLKRKTPYNTYVIRGLPPGPIASPGLKSIIAALNPANVPYLYFVSNNDGTHNFSVTLGEHSEAVREYRDKKRTGKEG